MSCPLPSSPPPFEDKESSPCSSGLRRVVRDHETIVRAIGGPRKCVPASHTRVQYASRFRTARLLLEWSQDKVASVLGCSRRWVIDFEKGRAPLTEESMDFTAWLETHANQQETGT